MPRSNITSGLSQWVVCDGTPYSVEIFRANSLEDWTVVVIDAIDKTTIWRHTEADDAIALMGAIAQVHSLAEPSFVPLKTANVRLC